MRISSLHDEHGQFHLQIHAVFARDDSELWMVKSVDLVTPIGGCSQDNTNNKTNIPNVTLTPLKLTRDEKADMKLLSERLEAHILPAVRCDWIDKYK